MGYDHRIIIDFDDTISFTLNRDWEHAAPNQAVIDKINDLYEQGWEVYIVTARGQLSCNGDSAAADTKYRKQIELWLEKHGVNYTLLSFQKFLAAYYVDDKMLSPEQFTKLEVSVLRAGQSGAFVERRGDRVTKTGARVRNEAEWYRIASDRIPEHLPIVYSFVGDTLTLEYVESSPPRKIGSREIGLLIDLILNFRKDDWPSSDASVDTMVHRLDDHIRLCEEDYRAADVDIALLQHHLHQSFSNSSWDAVRSFSHGDFSLDNILWAPGRVVLIDPIYDRELYSSYVLDFGKLLHSLHRHRHDEAYSLLVRRLNSLPIGNLKIAELSQWIRIVKYLQGDERARVIRFIADTQRNDYDPYGVEYR